MVEKLADPFLPWKIAAIVVVRSLHFVCQKGYILRAYCDKQVIATGGRSVRSLSDPLGSLGDRTPLSWAAVSPFCRTERAHVKDCLELWPQASVQHAP
jgi:hypothetical protein